MSLRNPSPISLKAISDKIGKTFDKLIEAMAFANLGSNPIVVATNNQHEFKSCKEIGFLVGIHLLMLQFLFLIFRLNPVSLTIVVLDLLNLYNTQLPQGVA